MTERTVTKEYQPSDNPLLVMCVNGTEVRMIDNEQTLKVIRESSKILTNTYTENIKKHRDKMAKLGKIRKHGRRKSRKEILNDRRNLLTSINKLKSKINILSGQEIGIFVLNQESEVVEVMDMNIIEDKADRIWWKTLVENPEIYREISENSELKNLLYKGLNLRIKAFDPDKPELNDVYYQFIESLPVNSTEVIFLSKFTRQLT